MRTMVFRGTWAELKEFFRLDIDNPTDSFESNGISYIVVKSGDEYKVLV